MDGLKMPLFNSGCILTKDMLDTIKDYELSFSNAVFSEYSNGILRGCQVSTQGSTIYVESGVVVYDHDIIFVPKTVLSPASTNSWQIINIMIGQLKEENDYMVRIAKVVISESDMKDSNAIEVCRVRLQHGAAIRSVYRNYDDMNTTFDTINLIESEWSSYRKSSINPVILEQFAMQAVKSALSNQSDISFIGSIMSMKGETLTRREILFYISTRLGTEYKEMTNEMIYGRLLEILRQIKTGRGNVSPARRERRIIVD